MSTPLLDIRSLVVSYGRVEAVHGVTLSVEPGSIVTVIGANGAGKTTLLNAAMGVLPAQGEIKFAGESLASWGIEDRVAMGMSLVPERRELFGTMTVAENLLLGGFRASAAQRAQGFEEVYGRFPRLKERAKQLAGTLSGGERQMLAMGRALMSRPRLLMLDEPSLGLAPLIVRDIFEIITGLRKTGVSILLVEQNARAALQAADRAYVMELGAITTQGPAAELAADPRVIESYLGLGKEEV
jgi:branched-chain amino acid transport system ATP-binding protein